MMRKLVEIRPKYNNGIVVLLVLMHRRGLQLTESSDSHCELVINFNSEMSFEEFLEKLKSYLREYQICGLTSEENQILCSKLIFIITED